MPTSTDEEFDTKYSWVVLAAATCMTILMGIHVGALGILLVEFIHYFQLKKSQVTWIGACSSIIGPVAGNTRIIPTDHMQQYDHFYTIQKVLIYFKEGFILK